MKTRLQNQTKPSSQPASTAQPSWFQQRPFSNSPQAAEEESSQTPNLQTQSDRSTHFSHNFGRVQVSGNPPAAIQPQLLTGQPEEQNQEKTDPEKLMAAPMSLRQNYYEELASAQPLSPLINPVVQRQEEPDGWVESNPLVIGARLPDQESEELVQAQALSPFFPSVVQRQEEHSEDLETLAVQPKLTVGAPGDRYEQETDVESIATQIVESLSADPEDQSGRLIGLLARLAPSIRQVVVARVQTQLSPQQQQTLSRTLARLNSDRGVASASQEEISDGRSGTATDNQSQPETEPGKHQTSQVADENTQSEKSTSEVTPEQSPTPTTETSQVATQRDKNRTASKSAKASAESAKATDRTSEKSPASPTNTPQKGVSTKSKTPHPKQGNSSPQAKSSGVSGSASKQSARSSGAPTSAGREGNSGERIAANSGVQSPKLQTPSARSQGTQALLDQVAATASSARQRFTDRITQGTEAIATSVQQQQAALITAGEQQTGAIQALFARARAQVGEIITSAQAQLQTDATSHLASLEQGHTATLGQVETAFSSGQERVQNLGNTYADRSLQTADDSAEQVQTRIQGMAQESRAIGQEKAQVGGSTPEIAQAKAKAANEIASDTATKITSGVSDAMRDLRATGPETARGFREQGQEAARQVGAGQAEVVNQLNTSSQQTASGIQQAVAQGSQVLGNLGTQLTAQLASLEQTIHNQLQTQIAQKSQEIYQAGQQAITTFQQQGQQAIASGDEHLAQFNQQLVGMDVKPELAAEVTGEIVGQVNGAYDNLTAMTDGAFQQADGALTRAGTEVMTAINGIFPNVAGQIQSFLGQAQGQVTQQVGTISGQLGTTVTQANTAGSGMVSQVTTSLDGQLGQIDRAFGQGLEQYRGALNQQITSAEGQAREPRQALPNKIETAQQRAEERSKQGFWERQWNDFVEMVRDPGFWAGLLVGLLVIGAVIALVALEVITGGTITFLIAAIIGGVLAGGIGSLVSQATKGDFKNLLSPDWSLVDWSKVGISALVGGIFGGVLALAEIWGAGVIVLSLTAGALTIITNLVTGGLDNWDKNLIANMLLVGLLSKLFRLVRGRTPKTEPPETKPPETKPPETKPPETKPPETKPPETKPPETKPPEENPVRPPVPAGRGVPLNKVRYSQKTVKNTTSEGQTIDQVAENMRRNGWDYSKQQPDMIDWGDGEFQTLDHRRLVAANRAELEQVGANIHPANEPIPPDQAGRFPLRRAFTDPETGTSYTKGQLPTTWGEAAMFRAANQGKSFPIRGSRELPTVTGGGEE